MTNAIAPPPRDNATSDAPKEAFRLACSPMQFAEIKSDDPDVRPFQMVARSPDAIDHWYWGRIVHDFSGMQLRKSSCPVDYCHDERDEIGFADSFQVTDDGLVVSGSLIVLEDNDRASKVFKRGKAGMPYEASIDWIGSGSELEYIPEDVTTEVNGRQFEGPGYVVRKWPLRSVAVCPYGADADTSTQFSDDAGNVSVRVFTQGEDTMSKDTPRKTDDEQGDDAAKTHSESPVVPAGTITPDTLKKFGDAFGDKAMTYLTAGLTFESATLQFAEHRVEVAEANAKKFADAAAAKDKEIEELQTKLKQFGKDLGESDPVATDPDDAGKKKARVFSGGKAVRSNADNN